MNTNDLRYIKTEKQIRETYLKLVRNGIAPRLVDLCKTAQINKSTFYDHYESMQLLEERVRLDTTRELLTACPHILDAFSDTESFCRSIIACFQREGKTLLHLYGGDPHIISTYAEMVLIELYTKESLGNELTIRFAIAGATHILTNNLTEQSITELIGLIEALRK